MNAQGGFTQMSIRQVIELVSPVTQGGLVDGARPSSTPPTRTGQPIIPVPRVANKAFGTNVPFCGANGGKAGTKPMQFVKKVPARRLQVRIFKTKKEKWQDASLTLSM